MISCVGPQKIYQQYKDNLRPSLKICLFAVQWGNWKKKTGRQAGIFFLLYKIKNNNFKYEVKEDRSGFFFYIPRFNINMSWWILTKNREVYLFIFLNLFFAVLWKCQAFYLHVVIIATDSSTKMRQYYEKYPLTNTKSDTFEKTRRLVEIFD